jgi:uncharacterized CHY-type Zn-finger protein
MTSQQRMFPARAWYRVEALRPHSPGKFISDGERTKLSCAVCRRLLTGDEYMNTSCEPLREVPHE